MPKIEIEAIERKGGTGYPEPFRKLVEGRFRKRLGNAVGLTQFGVNLTTLAPGAATAHRHWHHNEDEFVYILSGEATLVENGGETILLAGDAAGFKAGVRNGHHIVNRSGSEVVLLEVGTRAPVETAEYSDIDMRVEVDSRSTRYTRKDGTPY
ncbi:cupin domain-containing protein [Mesorhizobium sp. KR9-304]|uniref:cupin domain-containing protein n=1 Tax=Mesorhizobium sp. KR9-304 TaxID=3156614 RepID=UPI0032B5833F